MADLLSCERMEVRRETPDVDRPLWTSRGCLAAMVAALILGIVILAAAIAETAAGVEDEAAAVRDPAPARFLAASVGANHTSRDAGAVKPNNTTVPPAEVAPGSPDHVQWVTGTWTTGYWDCCKPSCAWPGKGKVDRPMAACHADSGEFLEDSAAPSVCNGGHAASCASHQPFLANENLALGFAAAAVSGHHGLTGDDNCGQCYQLRFVEQRHGPHAWGGAHSDLVNKSMVVQVTNIGHDVTGAHSFDIQIPGAGQGAFTGCSRQYPGFETGDFDCDTRYGGCKEEAGCSRLPKELRPGCLWRHRWLLWLRQNGQTNNPWVHFRRVRCPRALVAITGSAPTDDHLFQSLDVGDHR